MRNVECGAMQGFAMTETAFARYNGPSKRGGNLGRQAVSRFAASPQPLGDGRRIARRMWFGLCLSLFVFIGAGAAQDAPSSPDKPWQSDRAAQFARQLKSSAESACSLDPSHVYTLAELVDLAESHNPQTRVAWQMAKAQARNVGIREASLFPTLTAVAMASSLRDGALIGAGFHRQTIGLFQPVLELNYVVFDFGGRSGAIEAAKAGMYSADFAFNDTHRIVIYRVTEDYYKLLDAIGQEKAAQANLVNAQTVERDAQRRMDQGLATLPDLLETQAAEAQADYDLQSAMGLRETAQGDLATALGARPGIEFHVEDIGQLSIPDSVVGTADESIERALAQRPDLLEQVARVQAANAQIRQARASYFPTVSFSGTGGLARAYGQQDLLAGSYAESETWNAQLNVRWTLFDGLRRENTIAAAKAQRAAAQAQVESIKDDISNQVWKAYCDLQTALRQRRAAAALLVSADNSYAAAVKSYDLGVRNLLDVVSAQRSLAQARSADVSARTQVLTGIANLAFRTGDLSRTATTK